jgi:predicted RNA-binding Zn-ribbon protein involved in translation (DUF1610 family)
MVYRSYICDDCGFSSEETPGVYKCPECGSKMRIAQPSGAFGGGDRTRSDGKIYAYIFFFIIVGSILIGLLNIIGVILFIILFYFFRKALNDSMRDKAILISETENKALDTNIDSVYCSDCGQKLVTGAKFCPNCGKKI